MLFWINFSAHNYFILIRRVCVSTMGLSWLCFLVSWVWYIITFFNWIMTCLVHDNLLNLFILLARSNDFSHASCSALTNDTMIKECGESIQTHLQKPLSFLSPDARYNSGGCTALTLSNVFEANSGKSENHHLIWQEWSRHYSALFIQTN